MYYLNAWAIVIIKLGDYTAAKRNAPQQSKILFPNIHITNLVLFCNFRLTFIVSPLHFCPREMNLNDQPYPKNNAHEYKPF